MLSSCHAQIWLLGLAIATAGCGSEPAVEPVAAAPPVTTPAVAPAATPTSASSQVEAKAANEPDLAEGQQVIAVADYTPPFPERVEFFEPPKRAQSTVRQDEHGESVELQGFINVDEPRVVLSIDGVVSPIPEGGEKYGVKVIAIQPPSVVLERGRNRWKATLE